MFIIIITVETKRKEKRRNEKKKEIEKEMLRDISTNEAVEACDGHVYSMLVAVSKLVDGGRGLWKSVDVDDECSM